MSIIPSEPPAASRAALTSMFAAPTVGLGGPAVPAGELMAHRAFVMTADDCAAGLAPIDGARYLGWRYVVAPDARINVVMVAHDQVENAHVLAEIDHGPFATQTPDAINAMADIGAGEEAELELAFLGMPGLHLEAFWLKSQSGANDLFLPFGTLPPGVSRTIYPLTEWLEVVQQVAQRALEIGQM